MIRLSSKLQADRSPMDQSGPDDEDSIRQLPPNKGGVTPRKRTWYGPRVDELLALCHLPRLRTGGTVHLAANMESVRV